jgi:hypothetical protein
VKNKETAENNSRNFNLKLAETGLKVVTDWLTELCFCPLVLEDWNKDNKKVLKCQLTARSTG